MGLLDAISGRQVSVSTQDVAAELAPFLADGEQVELAFRLFRDMIVFTDRRLITIDRQGVTGKKVDYRTIPTRASPCSPRRAPGFSISTPS